MNDPNYRYSPWTPERRKAASLRAKARWAERKARETAEREKERKSASGILAAVRWEKSREMSELARRWHSLKAEVEEIDATLKLIEQIKPVLRKYQIGN